MKCWTLPYLVAGFVLLIAMTITSCTQDRKIDLSNLNLVRTTMTGQWYFISKNDTVSQYFIFTGKNYDGQCYSNQYEGGKPFSFIRDDNKTLIEWHITNGNPYYTIVELTANKMNIEFSNGNMEFIEYFKK